MRRRYEDLQRWWDSRPPGVHRAGVAAMIAAAAVLPLLFSPLSGFIGFAVVALAYVIMALGLNIVVGFAGLLDLGYVAFFAIGAYASGWFMSSFFASVNIHVLVGGNAANLPGIHLNFLLVLVLAAVLCALGGMLIGLPTLRLRGDYVAVVTLAFGEIIRVIATNGHQIAPFGSNFPLTNGSQGITPIDQVSLPFIKTFNQLDLRPWYWLILGMALVALFVTIRLRDSRLGRAWVAIREDEVAAVSMGIPLVRTKLAAYATGAAMGGVSGAFLGSYLNTVNSDQFAFSFSIFILAMVILGGLGSVKGVVLGAIVISFINNRLIPEILNGLPEKLGLHFQLTDIGFGVFGFLLVVVMVLLPEGLLPEKRHRLERVESAGTEDSVFEVQQ